MESSTPAVAVAVGILPTRLPTSAVSKVQERWILLGEMTIDSGYMFKLLSVEAFCSGANL